MKILHVSDLHLGKILNQHNLIEDQKFMLNEIKNTLINNEIKALIIAGDIFDRSIPSAEAVTVLSNFLQDIDKIGVETFIISGNHDSKERLGFLSPLLEKLSLHIVTTITVPLKSYTIGDINIYMMPYFTPLELSMKYDLGDLNIKSHDAAISYCIDNTNIDYKKTNILVAHDLFLNNKEKPVLSSEQIINIGTLDMVGVDKLKQFSYCALGHIHTPMEVGTSFINYSGSPMKYSEAEVGKEKGGIIISIDESSITKEFVTFKSLHNMREIIGLFDDIRKMDSSDDYIYIKLLDERIIPNSMSILKEQFPKALALTYAHDFYKKETTTKSANFENKSIQEQFSEFFEFINGSKLSNDEIEMFEKIMNGDEENEAN